MIIFTLICLLVSVAQAQVCTFGGELKAEGTLALGKGWRAAASEEMRYNLTSEGLSKNEMSAGLSKSVLRDWLRGYGCKMRIGGNYSFIRRQNESHRYENQHRVNVDVSPSYSYGDWKVSVRERVQTTFRDNRRGNYRVNPKMMLRSRLQVQYDIPGRPWTFFANGECFYRLNDPKHHIVDEWRGRIGASYQFSQHTCLSLYWKSSVEVNVKHPEQQHLLGLAFDFN